MDATHLIINQLRSRAQGAQGSERLTISPAAVRCLLQNWSTAENAGVRFRADGVVLGGIEFLLRCEVQPEVRAALKWRRAASLSPAGAQRLGDY